ncbi:MAG: glycosyltransferase, partial [Patescibacteria group bacterium]
VIRVANTLSVSLKGSKPLRRFVRWWGAVNLYWLANGIVVNSEGSAEDLSRTAWIYRKSITVIDNPAVTSDMLEQAKEPAGHPWLKDKEAPVVLSVGRFHKQKDFPTLIKAFARRRRKEPMKLIILGEGEKREELEDLVKELGVEESVSMPGFVENPYAYMSKADVFVLSSLWEGQPNALIEALACGAPVISTECPSGPKEILEDGIYGELVPVSDEKAMAEAIGKVLKEEPNTTVSREYARDRFSVEVVAEEYKKLMIR